MKIQNFIFALFLFHLLSGCSKAKESRLYTVDGTLSPYVVRTPSLKSMATPVYLQAGPETSRYLFLTTVRIDEKNSENMFPATYLVYDKDQRKAYRYKIVNEDYPDKEILLTAETIDHVDPSGYGFIRLRTSDLLEANEKGRLQGKLKEIAATLDEEDNDILMVMYFK